MRVCVQADGTTDACKIVGVGDTHAKMRNEPGVPESNELEAKNELDKPNGAVLIEAADKIESEVGASGALVGALNNAS